MTGFPNMHVIKKNIQNLPDMIAEEFEIRKPKPIIEDPIIERLRIEK